eukprot:CAMPEP_0201656352 /NCGR_PEP_ID=MMETSP0493-20130528/46481_1 /ASSEMBLY_ACC=CAM_ASM_000838 /TAXON_ID=420259 /ORGANISM="Thalassiosira gravida, Strain GMp14c1" /LENGTH=550 /DNA_ID=CAMNT_0048132963 /DNA_START=1 /DNA_END=1653 /DNA_ORIENTATION=+
MEMLVVARVLSRPEPPLHERDTCFYVSKSWCRTALRWLEVQEEERKEREEKRRIVEEAKLAASVNTVNACTPKGKGRKHNQHHHHSRKSPHHHHPGSSGKKKLSRKEQRQRDRRMSDAMPPWSNINNDIVCEHGSVKQLGSSKSARARRRVMDKQAWRVLKRLYPDSVQLEATCTTKSNGSGGSSYVMMGCLICAAEAETAKKAELDKKEEERADRKLPLGCPLVRGFYTRGSKGYPTNYLASQPTTTTTMLDYNGVLSSSSSSSSSCPLIPGVYCALPRSWCHRWRKYIKTGEGGPVPAPDATEALCEAHNLPLVPPHLESFLRGETSTLLGSGSSMSSSSVGVAGNNDGDGGDDGSGSNNVAYPAHVVGAHPTGNRLGGNRRHDNGGMSRGISDAETRQALRAAGLSEGEIHAQRAAMVGIEDGMRHASIVRDVRTRPRSDSTGHPQQQQQQQHVVTNEQLDRENQVVVEILTDEEASALEKWWPRCHGGAYALRFAVVANDGGGSEGRGAGRKEVVWSTAPCRECDPSSRSATDFVVRNRMLKKGHR